MLKRSLNLIVLLALAGTARSEQQPTNAASQSHEPVRSTQTAKADAQSNTSTNDAQFRLGMEMQNAVLKTQDFKEIKRLLKAGFKIDDPIGCGTFNCVDGAVTVRNLEFLKFFLDSGAKPKGSALFQAAWCKNESTSYKMVQMLLKAGADANYKSQGLTPLGSACYLDHLSVVELLVNQPGIELNYLDTDHVTPLMTAARKGDVKMVRLLLDKGADPVIAGPPDPNHGKDELPKRRTAADYTRNEEILNLLANYKRPPMIATPWTPITR